MDTDTYRATPEQMWEAIMYGDLVPDKAQSEYAEMHMPLPWHKKPIETPIQ